MAEVPERVLEEAAKAAHLQAWVNAGNGPWNEACWTKVADHATRQYFRQLVEPVVEAALDAAKEDDRG